MNTSDGREYYGFGIDNSQLRREAQRAINIFDGIGSKAEAEGARIDASFRRAGQAVGAYFSVQQFSSFIGSVAKIRGEIEALEISFETLLGNKDKAKEFFGEIKDFAVNTPMQLGDLAKGAQTLLGFNIEAEKVMPILRQIGDISMGDAQKFDSLVLAFSQMSSTGKLMGQDLLQMINAGFNPLVEMSKITGKSISELKDDMSAGAISADMVAEAFAHAAGEGGTFNGMLEKQSKGLQGAISNLQGAWDDMLNDIGSKHQEVFVDAIQTVTELAKSYEGVGKVIVELIATYGVYKAAVITLSTVENLRYQSTLAHMAGLTKMQAVMEVLKAKTDALNVAMAKNPYMLAAAAVAALAYGIYKLTTYQTDAEKAQKKLNEATKQYEQGAASEQIQIDRLFAKLNAATEGTEEYEDAKKAIINQYGQYLQGLDKEKAALNDVAGAYKAITEAAKEAARARAMQSFSQSAADEYGKKIGDERESLRKALEKQYKGKKGADGIGLAETYFWKIVPVLEGKEKMTKEIEDMIKPLDKTHFVQGDPMTGIGAYSYTSNAAREAIANAAKARKVYDDVMKDAETRFGSLPAKDSGKPGQEEAKKATVKNREFWENEKKSLQKTLDAMSDAELKTQKAKDLRKKIADAQAKIDAYNVQKTAKGSKDYAKDNDAFFRLKDAQTIERERAAKDAEFAVRQAEIDAKQESSEKIREQMELDHAKELEMLDREKADYLQRKVDNARALFEANPANKGKVFNGSNITLTPEENASFAQRKKFTEQKQANEGQELLERQRTTMNEYLKEFGDYMEKRQAIIDLYNAQMAKATTEGERLSLSATMKRELSELDIEANKSTAAISRLFDDMTNKTVKDLRKIADAGEEALQFLIDGEWDEAKGIEFGMSQETFDTLRKSPAELEKIRKAIKQIREEADKSDTAFNKMANGLKKVFAAGNDTKKLKDGLGMIEDGFNDVMQVAGFLQDSLSNLGDALGSDALKGAAEGISAAMDVANATMSGAQAGAMFGPWGAAAGAAIGLVSSLGSAIAKLHDAKHEKKIKKLQEQIEVLEKSYDKLGRSVEKAYSKDASKMIEQQNTLLEQQKVLIRNQIAEEKAKKKTDWDRIKEWENQIEEIDQLIADNKEKAVDAIFGEDLKSAIDNFSSAYAEAWASGGDKAKSAKDVVRKMMQQMVTESIKAAIQSSKSMEQIRQKLQEFYADNVLSPWEQDYIYRMAENLQKELDDQFGWADSLMYEGSSASQDSTKRGFATASQDSIDELNGRFTAIQLNSEEIKRSTLQISIDTGAIRQEAVRTRETAEEIREISLLSLGHLENIDKNTRELYSMNEKLSDIKKSLKKL